MVIVRGESGVGKTALVRAFTERLLADSPEAVVLAGRCFERESVPYKGLDSVIDALAGKMRPRLDDGPLTTAQVAVGERERVIEAVAVVRMPDVLAVLK